MSLFGRLKDALLNGGEDLLDLDPFDQEEQCEDSTSTVVVGSVRDEESIEVVTAGKLDQLRRDNERVTRINGEYFGLIEQMERERNEWKDMYFTQSSEHQTAQSMLRNNAVELGQQLRAAIAQLNIYRNAAGHEPIVEPKCLEKMPGTLPEDYGKRMADLVANKKPDTDAKKARAAIK
jgi:hypothetical protein